MINKDIKNNHKSNNHLLPNWKMKKFKDIVNYNIGRTPARKKSEFWKNGIYHWVSIADMRDSPIIKSTKEKISQIALNNVFNG